MKNFFYQAASFGTVCLVMSQLAIAQPAVPPPPPPAPKSEVPGKGEQSEIIIRQKGDKDTKLTLEIKNGDYFINGKPLEKFDDENIIVEKRDIDDNDIVVMPDMVYSPSPFRKNQWDDERMDQLRGMEDAQRESEDAQKRVKRIQIRMNSAFLGVSSRRAEKGGATVLEVTKGSPAEKAGIRKGDIITKVNDAKVESPETLFETVRNYKPGDKVKIVFTRDGKEQTVFATLDKTEYRQKDYNYNYNFRMPPMPDMNDMHMDEFWGGRQPKIGLTAQDSEDEKGVRVLEVEDSSAAFKAGLKKGDIILLFDGNEVNSANELVDQLQEAKHKGAVKVKILRGTVTQELELKIPRKLKTAEL
jgi:serine protease Do